MSISQYNSIFSETFPKKMFLEFSDETLIENDQICSEEMSLEESLCSDANLKYGTCESSCFKVRVVNNNNFKGLKLNVSMELKGVDAGRLIDSDGNYLVDSDENYLTYYDASNPSSATIDIGEYYVVDDEPSNDRMWRDLTCYDAMYFILNADVSAWYSGLTFPMSMKNFRDSFFTWINTNVVSITQKTVTLINDNFMIQGGFEADQLSGKDVIQSICELNACFGHIDSSGKFDYITLPSSETITYEWYIDGTGSYEDYVTDTITKVLARGEADDVGTSVGVDGNTLIIENNPLIYGTEGTQALEDALDNILDVVELFTYRPFSVDTYGNPMLPIGTSVVINTRRYDPENGYSSFAINSFVMSRTLTGIQALRDSISASGDKEIPSEVNSLQSQILRTKGKVHTVINTVDELSSEIYEVDPQTGTKTSKIQQLSDEIVLKVTSGGQIVQVALSADASTGSSFKVHASNIELTANDKLVLTTGTFEVSSTNLTITSTGSVTCEDLTANVSGEIGGWEITSTGLKYESSSTNFILLNSLNKSVIVRDGNKKAAVTSGGIKLYYNEQEAAYLRSENYGGTASGSNTRGTAINIESGASYFDLGYYDSGDDEYKTALMINNGLNPDGYTEKIIASSKVRFKQNIYFGSLNYFLGEGSFTFDNVTYDVIWAGAHFYINGNLRVAGSVLGNLSFNNSNNYVASNNLTWWNGTTYPCIKIAPNIYTAGHAFVDGGVYADGTFGTMASSVLIGTSSNNGVTSTVYKGYGCYDNTGGTRYVEFFSAAESNGLIRGYMLAKNKKTDGTEVSNQLGCGVQKDGTLTYTVSSPANFRSAIGVNGIGETTADNDPGTESASSGSWKSVATLASLAAGKYLLIGTADIEGDSAGNRYMVISNGIDGTQISRHARVSAKNAAGRTSLQIVCPINISSATTYHLNVYQDSGSTLDATGRLTAIKIRG